MVTFENPNAPQKPSAFLCFCLQFKLPPRGTCKVGDSRQEHSGGGKS